MTGEGEVVWHDEAQRFHDLGLLDPPTFCTCDDCLTTPPGETTATDEAAR